MNDSHLASVAAFASLAVAIAWLALAVAVVYDVREFAADMERMGRHCADLYQQPYVGKTCRQLLGESK